MKLDQFCHGLETLGLDSTQYALAILWFHDEETPNVVMAAGQLAKIINEAGLGNPNSTRLRTALRESGMLLASK